MRHTGALRPGSGQRWGSPERLLTPHPLAGPLAIQEQGSFAVGRTVITRSGHSTYATKLTQAVKPFTATMPCLLSSARECARAAAGDLARLVKSRAVVGLDARQARRI